MFFSDDDRRAYLELLHAYAKKHGLAIHAYCLMKNHVHLVATPHTADSLAGTLKPVHLRYTQHVNWAHGMDGRLWQGRYFSCVVDPVLAWNAVRHVESNPVRAGLVAYAEDYPWSSAAAHCGLRADTMLVPLAAQPAPSADWAQWLCEAETDLDVALLRRSTSTGRPLGSNAFLERLEAQLGRTLRPRRAGRPRKPPSLPPG